jgi:hypothetical protein
VTLALSFLFAVLASLVGAPLWAAGAGLYVMFFCLEILFSGSEPL